MTQPYRGPKPHDPVELAHKVTVREEARKAKEAAKEVRRKIAAGNRMILHQIRAACKEAEEACKEVETDQSQVLTAMDLGRPAYLTAHDRFVRAIKKLKSAEAKEMDAVTSAGLCPVAREVNLTTNKVNLIINFIDICTPYRE